MKHLSYWIAIGFGSGLMPRAPGTFGSLLGLPLGYAIHRTAGLSNDASLTALGFATITIAGFIAIAWLSIDHAERHTLPHDDQRIVIDEVVSQAIAVAFLPPTAGYYLAGFILFRLFDIAKPGPIGWADRSLKGAWGTLLDDLLAAVATGFLLLIAKIAFS